MFIFFFIIFYATSTFCKKIEDIKQSWFQEKLDSKKKKYILMITIERDARLYRQFI